MGGKGFLAAGLVATALATFTPNFGAAGISPTNLTLRKKLKK
jgi:hypothetical protein